MNGFGKSVVGLGTVSLAAALGYFLYERSTEQPDYWLILKDGPFEIRQYPSMLVAETIAPGSRDEALNRGFRKLADYIFAKSRRGEKISMTAPLLQGRERISMTAPVLQDQAEVGWRTRFIMPARYNRATLPSPPEGVNIDETPARCLVAVRFGGRANDAAIAIRESELRRWMSGRDLEASGSAEYAFYNSPVIPPFLRRNEILIPL